MLIIPALKEAEAGELPVQGPPGKLSATLAQKKKLVWDVDQW